MRKAPSVLVVDDEKVMFDLVSAIMNKERWEWAFAPDGEVGIQQMKHLRPDLVILDYMMPGMDGET